MKKLVLVFAVLISQLAFGQTKKTTTNKPFQPPYEEIVVDEIIEPGCENVTPTKRYLLMLLFGKFNKEEFKTAQQFTYNKVRSTSIFDWNTQIILDRDKWLDTLSINRYLDFDKYDIEYMVFTYKTNMGLTRSEWFVIRDKQTRKKVRRINFLYKNEMELIDILDSDIKNINYKR